MNKGFTLIELLAVIAVLGIILVIFVPNAFNIVNDNSTKVYHVKEEVLVNAAKDYVLSNSSFILPTGDDASYITSNTLVSGAYMTKIIDNTSANECNAFVKITVNSTYGYTYSPCLLCDNYTTDVSFCTTANYNNI